MTDPKIATDAEVEIERLIVLGQEPDEFGFERRMAILARLAAAESFVEHLKIERDALRAQLTPGKSDREFFYELFCDYEKWHRRPGDASLDEIHNHHNELIQRITAHVAARVNAATKPWREMVERLVQHIGPYEDDPISPISWPKVCEDARRLLAAMDKEGK